MGSQSHWGPLRRNLKKKKKSSEALCFPPLYNREEEIHLEVTQRPGKWGRRNTSLEFWHFTLEIIQTGFNNWKQFLLSAFVPSASFGKCRYQGLLLLTTRQTDMNVAWSGRVSIVWVNQTLEEVFLKEDLRPLWLPHFLSFPHANIFCCAQMSKCQKQVVNCGTFWLK